MIQRIAVAAIIIALLSSLARPSNMMLLGIGGFGSGAVAGCAGVINLSTGCPQPMLGVF
jgi:hypothetical protein